MSQKSKSEIFTGHGLSPDFLSADTLLGYLEGQSLTEQCLHEHVPPIFNNGHINNTSATGFGYLIHRLKTSFKKREGDFYLKIFPSFILEARNQSPLVEEWFVDMQIHNDAAADLYERSINLRKPPQPISASSRTKIKKVILLPRNTIGAEAFVNGTLLTPILDAFENAEVVFIDTNGSGKYLFNYSRVVSKKDFLSNGETTCLSWNRSQVSNLERIINTVKISQFIDYETRGLKDDEYLIIDADTRGSQTGAMPISKKNHYFIDTVLESDSLPIEKVDSISMVCSRYLNHLFGTSQTYYPSIRLSNEDMMMAEKIWNSLRLEKKKVALVSFTAGLLQKTLSDRYERQALLSLLDRGITPLIERAPSREEDEKNVHHVKYLRARGITVSEIHPSSKDLRLGSDVYTIDCKVGLLCGMLEKSNLVLSYDSKNQHLASALNRPLITVFTGHPNSIFLHRWTPSSRNYLRTIEVDKNPGDYENNPQFRNSCDDLAIKELEKALDYCSAKGIV